MASCPVKVYKVFDNRKEIAIGTQKELAQELNVSVMTVATWASKGKKERFINSIYKHAVFDEELSRKRFPDYYSKKDKNQQKAEEGKEVKVFDLFEKGQKIYTGTIKEISEFTGKNKRTLYYHIKKDGKYNSGFKLVQSGVVFEKVDLNEIAELERRKHETKEERRLRRNIRAQMAIEAIRDERNVFN